MSATASGAWGPAPAGVDLSENQNANIIASVTVVMVIGLAAVALRLYARLSRTGPGLGTDDYVVLTASALAIGNAVCCLISIQWGGGKHLWVITTDEFIKLWQTTLAFVVVYINSITFTKISILLFYRRVFGTSIIWYIVFGFAVAHGVEVTVTILAGCQPLSYFWNQYADPTSAGSCIDTSLFYFINGIIGMVIDISILLVPIPTVYRLKMPPAQKLFVCSILLLGSFVCVASVVRIVMMNKLVHSADFTWAMCQVFIWSCVEPFIGILCACLPTYAPLVRHWYSVSGSQNGKGQSFSSYYKYPANKPNPNKRFGGVLDTTVHGGDEIEFRTNTGGAQANAGGKGYTYVVHSSSGSTHKPESDQDILVRTDFSFSSNA